MKEWIKWMTYFQFPLPQTWRPTLSPSSTYVVLMGGWGNFQLYCFPHQLNSLQLFKLVKAWEARVLWGVWEKSFALVWKFVQVIRVLFLRGAGRGPASFLCFSGGIYDPPPKVLNLFLRPLSSRLGFHHPSLMTLTLFLPNSVLLQPEPTVKLFKPRWSGLEDANCSL